MAAPPGDHPAAGIEAKPRIHLPHPGDLVIGGEARAAAVLEAAARPSVWTPLAWVVVDGRVVLASGSVPFSTTAGACSMPNSTVPGAALAAVTPTAKATASPATTQRDHALFMRFAPFCEPSPDGTSGR